MKKYEKILILGHKGVLGHAVWNQLEQEGYTNLAGADLPEVDLCDEQQVKALFERESPAYVFFFAALSGGIQYRRDFADMILMRNLRMTLNVIDATESAGCKKVMNISSALIYPDTAPMPYREKEITSVDIKDFDSAYILSKAAGLQLCRFYDRKCSTKYVTVIPCNFFGENSIFEGDKATFVPALISRMHKAKKHGHRQVTVWGTGNACRELMNSKDVAKACITIMNSDTEYDVINIGRGYEFSVKDVAYAIKDIVGYDGEIIFDDTKPEGAKHMQMNVKRLTKLGFTPELNLRRSIRDAYSWYLKEIGE